MGEVSLIGGLCFKIKQFPPSSNHCYFNHPRGGRAKTQEATAFERRFISEVHQHLPLIQRFFSDRTDSSIYSVVYQLFFPHEEVINKTFKSGKKGAAETRYKIVDAENRNKLISDSLAKALGLNDTLFFSVRADKMSARLVDNIPQIWIFVQKADPTFFGV